MSDQQPDASSPPDGGRPPSPWAAAAVLADIHAQIPQVACRGLCARHDCADDIGMGARERQRLRQAGVPMPTRHHAAAHGARPCPALSQGRCSAYEVRPTICRVFGATEGLAYPHGCEVIEGRPLTMAEGFALVDAAAVAGTARQPMTAEQASQVLPTAQVPREFANSEGGIVRNPR
ncbi:YkgJ family cysteine cluster protein [Streptosporangium canum]|uniref:YkgJ family cysteine cluster protein n=1 Tax=Streptosporangium canum TaxID=324952 RepID=UPI0034381E81